RYVVGYSSGQQVGEDTYEVRAMNAHAWVEVYFEDIGWVRFDPTPATERLSVQEEALESSGEEIDPGEIELPENLNPGTAESDSSGFETTLNQTALPGEPVEVSVTYEGTPVIQETVYFNGEPVGRTDSDGTVVGIVPDAEELRISIEEHTRSSASDTVMDDDQESASQPVQASGGSSASTVSTGQADDDRTDTHPIERTASLAISGETTPGETVTVTATAGDRLLDGATIRLDGEPVGQTDERGQIDVRLPDEPGTVSVAAQRGLVDGERTIEIPELTVSVERDRLPAMALGTVTVRAEIGEEAAAGVPVEMNGRQIATTGADGTATVQLPLASETTLSVAAAGQSQQVVLDGLLWRFGAGALLAFVAVAIPPSLLLRRGYGPGKIGHIVVALPGKLAVTGRTAVVKLVTNGGSYLARTGGRIRRLFGGVMAILRGERSLAGISSSVAAWLAGGWQRLTRRLAGLRPGDQTDRTESQLTVQEAWRQFLNELDVGRVETRTPGELASYAVEKEGLPREPVLALRDTFREVEYGSRQPTDRLDRVQDAIDQIQRANDPVSEEGEA
ncbi:MAG: transglutaminase domain-containing protein, partial [Halovenus sp.]